jgi:hypothetical protein
MSNFRFLVFLIAFAAFLWFVFMHEPEPDRVYVSPQSETAEQQDDNWEDREHLSSGEQRAFAKDRVRKAARF